MLHVSGAGRRFSSLRLLPFSALDSGDVKNAVVEISETKGESSLVQHTNTCTCTLLYRYYVYTGYVNKKSPYSTVITQ